MKKILMIILIGMLCLVACGSDKDTEIIQNKETETLESEIIENEISSGFSEFIESGMEENSENEKEKELLSIMQSKIGCELENYVYVDMDKDGFNELIGVFKKEGYYQTWYCSSDGVVCELVHKNDGKYLEFCNIEALDVENEMHVILNFYMSMGTNKNCSILALRDKRIEPLILNEWGMINIEDNGDITYLSESYDGFYDPNIDGWILHTWKYSYLFFDGVEYKEYGAKELSEEEYLKFQNAEAIKSKIDSEKRESDTVLLEYKYFKRKNGILHIQCNVHNDSGEIRCGYYTIRYSDNVLDDEVMEYNEGQMAPYFSDLEVVYE